MNDYSHLKNLGFSQYEIACYLSLMAKHPSNGSQLSRQSGIARSRIYDVLRNMTRKGLVLEVEDGQYVPLPADELIKRLRSQFEADLSDFEEQIRNRRPGNHLRVYLDPPGTYSGHGKSPGYHRRRPAGTLRQAVSRIRPMP